MKSFILKIIAFSVCLAVPPFILQHIYDNAACSYDKTWLYHEISTAYNDSSNADLIILGNSRGANYNVEIIDSTLSLRSTNLAIAGYPFDFIYNIMYKGYSRHNRNPRYIIIDIGPWVFFHDVNPNYRIEFLPYIDRPEFEFLIKKCPELTPADKYLPTKYMGLVSQCITNYINFVFSDSVQPETQSGYQRVCFGEEKFHPLENDSDKVALFISFLEECKAKGIKAVMICSPMHTVDACPHFDMKKFTEMVNAISAKEGVPFIDYTRLYGSDTLRFSNEMHLNSESQKAYTLTVCKELKSRGFIP